MHANTELVRDARARHFRDNGFSEAAYTERWAKVKLGRLPLVFPNIAERKRALPLHDLHHIATGYATTLTGEAEIGAWEVGSGCADYIVAWLLDAGAFATGLLFAPRRVYRAFVRGRHSRTLYRDGWRDELLGLSVGELRRRLHLDRPAPRASWRDRVAFAAWVAVFQVPPLALLLLVFASVS
jgi:hypothetical protein